MDLEVLTTRNRIEDHQVSTEYADTDNMLADIGTKALTVPKFPRFRDTMNGYALVKAKYPDLDLPDYVYQISDEDKPDHKRGSKLECIQSMIMDFQYVKWDEDHPPPIRCALAHEELTYEDFIGHMSGNYGTPVYCDLCRYELNHKDCDNPKCDLCHYETAMTEGKNGSSPDPGSHQEEEVVMMNLLSMMKMMLMMRRKKKKTVLMMITSMRTQCQKKGQVMSLRTLLRSSHHIKVKTRVERTTGMEILHIIMVVGNIKMTTSIICNTHSSSLTSTMSTIQTTYTQ